MKKLLFLTVLICIGCSIKYSDIKFDENDIKIIAKGADSEAWCEVVFCVNGSGYTGPIKLHTLKKNNEAQQIEYVGISSDGHNEYKKVNRKRINKKKYDIFLNKLVDAGIFNMNDIDLEKLPANENALNPWEESFTKIPSATNFIEFFYFIRIGEREHKFYGFEIEIFKDKRYIKIVEIFNEFFEQRLGGIKFDSPIIGK